MYDEYNNKMKKHIQKWKSINKNGLKLSFLSCLLWYVDVLHATRYSIIYSESFRANHHTKSNNRCYPYGSFKRF